jgi:hypothetical protein
MDFNNWTVGTIKEQIENGKYPNVDFKIQNHAYVNGYITKGRNLRVKKH